MNIIKNFALVGILLSTLSLSALEFTLDNHAEKRAIVDISPVNNLQNKTKLIVGPGETKTLNLPDDSYQALVMDPEGTSQTVFSFANSVHYVLSQETKLDPMGKPYHDLHRALTTKI